MDEFKLQTRYAQSLFDLAKEDNKTKEVFDDMSMIKKVCQENHEFQVILKNPIIKPLDKKSILEKLFKDRCQELTISFLSLIVKKRRDIYLLGICERYLEIYKKANNIKTTELITAQTLSQDIISQIKEQLKKELNSDIDLQIRVNPKLIGGFCLTLEGKQYDASFLNKLIKLKKMFAKDFCEKVS